MKATNAVIGGEGNGGVIYPASHYGRDALVGIALFLSHLAHEGKKVSELRATYPPYFIAKNRVDLTPEIDVDAILAKVCLLYTSETGARLVEAGADVLVAGNAVFGAPDPEEMIRQLHKL